MAPKRRAAPQSEYRRKTEPYKYRSEDTRLAWVQTDNDTWVLYKNPPNEEKYETTATVCLTVVRGKMSFPVDFTHLTTPEFDAVERIILRALEEARPLVEERDRRAHDDAETGVRTEYRVYRRLPLEVVREGDGGEYVEGVRFRPRPVSERIGDDLDPVGRVRRAGGSLADHASGSRSTEDDESSDDFAPSLREGDDGS